MKEVKTGKLCLHLLLVIKITLILHFTAEGQSTDLKHIAAERPEVSISHHCFVQKSIHKNASCHGIRVKFRSIPETIGIRLLVEISLSNMCASISMFYVFFMMLLLYLYVCSLNNILTRLTS